MINRKTVTIYRDFKKEMYTLRVCWQSSWMVELQIISNKVALTDRLKKKKWSNKEP